MIADNLSDEANSYLKMFTPEIMRSLRNQYTRYTNIQKAKGETELNFIEFINMVILVGLHGNIGILLKNENQLGLDQGEQNG
jgi:hypothetical protein